MSRTARGLENRGHRVWILAHPRGRFLRSAPRGTRVIPRRLGMDYSPAGVAAVRRLIRRHRIQLLLTNIEKEVIIGGMAARCCRIPNLRRVGREDDFNTRRRVRWHHRLLVDHAVTPCDAVQRQAKKRAPWLDLSRFTTIYNGRNPAFFNNEAVADQRRCWGLSSREIIIGVTSQLAPVKGIDDLVGAFSRLALGHPQARLVICGEGRHRKALEDLADRLGIRQGVVFAGFSQNPLLAAAAYDIAVSNSRFEGFPNTVVEYFAAGRPVVTTDAGGVTEMAVNGENALVIPRQNAAALEAALDKLLLDAALRRRLAANARQTLINGFTETMMLDQLEALCRRLIARKRMQRGAPIV